MSTIKAHKMEFISTLVQANKPHWPKFSETEQNNLALEIQNLLDKKAHRSRVHESPFPEIKKGHDIQTDFQS